MDWTHLTRLSGGARLVIERARLADAGIAIEGSFELPPLARPDIDDQVFVAAFVTSHGSIKEMERLFGVSYPTIKARLNRLAAALGGDLSVDCDPPADRGGELLDRLERGEISAGEAAEALQR